MADWVTPTTQRNNNSADVLRGLNRVRSVWEMLDLRPPVRHGQVVAGVNASPRYDAHLEENADAWGDEDPGLQPLEKAAWREWDLILVAGWRKGSLPGRNEGHSQRRRSRCFHKISKSGEGLIRE